MSEPSAAEVIRQAMERAIPPHQVAKAADTSVEKPKPTLSLEDIDIHPSWGMDGAALAERVVAMRQTGAVDLDHLPVLDEDEGQLQHALIVPAWLLAAIVASNLVCLALVAYIALR